MKDKNTIINEMVSNTADILQMKLEYNVLIIEQVEAAMKSTVSEIDLRASALQLQNKRIEEAISLLREFEGSWV